MSVGGGQKRSSNPLELELQVPVSCPIWVFRKWVPWKRSKGF